MAGYIRNAGGKMVKKAVTLNEKNLVIIAAAIIVIAVLVLVSQQPAEHYCGNGVCDPGESALTCQRDCGDGEPNASQTGEQQPQETPPETEQPPQETAPEEPEQPPGEQPAEPPQQEGQSYSHDAGRELDPNVFEDTIGVEQEDAYKEDGYVIVRYFYNANCPLCVNPVDWEGVLRRIASEMNDVVILELFDSASNSWAKDRWAKAGIDVPPDPVIRIEGKPGGQPSYKILYGNPLSEFYGSPKERLVEEICKYTDRC